MHSPGLIAVTKAATTLIQSLSAYVCCRRGASYESAQYFAACGVVLLSPFPAVQSLHTALLPTVRTMERRAASKLTTAEEASWEAASIVRGREAVDNMSCGTAVNTATATIRNNATTITASLPQTMTRVTEESRSLENLHDVENFHNGSTAVIVCKPKLSHTVYMQVE